VAVGLILVSIDKAFDFLGSFPPFNFAAIGYLQLERRLSGHIISGGILCYIWSS
jgi:hypothetical protein